MAFNPYTASPWGQSAPANAGNPYTASASGSVGGIGGSATPKPWNSFSNTLGGLGKAVGSAIGQGQANGFQPTSPTGSTPPAATPPKPGVLSDPGYGEDWYKAHGADLSGPSSSRTLFNEGAAGSNPFYDNAQKMVDQSINDAASVRGGWNSSSTLNTLGIANADLRGQQAHELGQLAGQADTADTSRYGASSAAANAAQNQTEGRAGQVANGYLNLSKDQASLVQGFYDMAAKGLTATDMAAIEAQMRASGMDAQEIASVTNDLLKIGGIGATAASGGGKSP